MNTMYLYSRILWVIDFFDLKIIINAQPIVGNKINTLGVGVVGPNEKNPIQINKNPKSVRILFDLNFSLTNAETLPKRSSHTLVNVK